VTSFAQITSNVTLQNQLQQLYGNVNNIDMWVGGLAENHVAGTSTGPLIRSVVADQFTRLRDGDSFWYQNIFDPISQLILESTQLSDSIAANWEINNLQNNVFFFRVTINGEVFNDLNHDGVLNSGEPGLGGRTVQLFDDTGTLLATKTTASDGSYSFNNT